MRVGLAAGSNYPPLSFETRCDIQIFQTMEEVTNQIYDIFVEIQSLVLHEETFTSRSCERAESKKTAFESLWASGIKRCLHVKNELYLCCMLGLWCLSSGEIVITFFEHFVSYRALFSSVPMHCLSTHALKSIFSVLATGKILQILPGTCGTLASHKWLVSDLSKDDCAGNVPDGGNLIAIGWRA